MRFYLFATLACYLTFGHAGTVFAQELSTDGPSQCEAALSNTTSAQSGIFEPTEAKRLISLYGSIHSQDLNQLTSAQKKDLLSIANRLIKNSRKGFKSFSKSIEKNKDVESFFQQIEARFDDLESINQKLKEEKTLSYSQLLSYLQVVNAVTNYAAQLRDPKIWLKEFGQIQLPFIENKLLIYRESIRKKIDLEIALSQSRPRGPWASHSFFIPTDHPLSIVDFNFLVGTGLIPIGFIPEALDADGTTMLPEEFTIHDQGHSEQMPGQLSREQLNAWNILLSWANQGTEKESAIRHALLFQLSHETVFIRLVLNTFFNKTQTHIDYFYAIEDLPNRIRKEGYWDLPALQEIENLESAIKVQADILEKLIFGSEFRSALGLK